MRDTYRTVRYARVPFWKKNGDALAVTKAESEKVKVKEASVYAISHAER
jgi:hypothetical protein